MKTVKEVAALTGVSVRTLHHYDAIGLLAPSRVTDAGYRLYDDKALERLHTILLLRQLQFPLKEIRQILDSPNSDPPAGAAESPAGTADLPCENNSKNRSDPYEFQTF